MAGERKRERRKEYAVLVTLATVMPLARAGDRRGLKLRVPKGTWQWRQQTRRKVGEQEVRCRRQLNRTDRRTVPRPSLMQ